ncbi:UDP-2,3-diacylglucosamine hydrolase [Roseateles sp. YR242]|uniref:UDP-2,3-diacylglucosamine diphosphatase n=1 Tax=Roseateles sp. YR242 TaxID=1855305 RepID=UPI0008D4C512|nr:UDP-2,3-diacylglucosamine diphosphatase [Roseateles sp. YR242]SEK28788.1 UDP-2,3-diacylglucosamine hydrolase [Roseateles sp. YR242]
MNPASFPLPGPLATLRAEPGWRRVDVLSDLHLSPALPRTLERLREHLAATPADAVFLLGDIFEAWIGDDVRWVPDSFEQQCMAMLRDAARRTTLFFMHGNRDFMLGPAMAQDAGMRLVDDPLRLDAFGRSWLLSHGDLLCLGDVGYQRVRAVVRRPTVKAVLLALPLSARRALARHLRGRSMAHQQDPALWADVDDQASRDWLRAAGCDTLIHGHTHRPAEHALGTGMRRVVLSDWDFDRAQRGDVLVLDATGIRRDAPMRTEGMFSR